MEKHFWTYNNDGYKYTIGLVKLYFHQARHKSGIQTVRAYSRYTHIRTTEVSYNNCKDLKMYSIFTLRSQIRTWPPKHPDANISWFIGWKQRHHGVRGCPFKVCTSFPDDVSNIFTVWSPFVEATFELEYKSTQQILSCLCTSWKYFDNNYM